MFWASWGGLFWEPVPGSMASDRSRGPKVVLTVSDVLGFDGFGGSERGCSFACYGVPGFDGF